MSYAPFTRESLPAYLAALPGVAARLGGTVRGWTVSEVGDGNLNMVFIVAGPQGSLVVKQALPYVRLVGESWPLSLTRSWFEASALDRQAKAAPALVPRVHHADRARAAIVMEHLTPHVILRKALIAGRTLPRLAHDMGLFLAETLFRTSDLHLGAAEKKALVAEFAANTELCRITEDLVFTDPYREAPLNRWTSPELDPDAAAIRADAPLRAAVQELKYLFLTRGEALLHGDLHTGSIMVTESETRVIDPEFAFVGPIGFDVGALLANLAIAWLAAPAHQPDPAASREFRAWVGDTIEQVWTGFEARFRHLWREVGGGDAFPRAMFADPDGAAALDAAQDRAMEGWFADTLGFAGAKMIRRVLGLAHVEDLESIEDTARRAAIERQVLSLGRTLILERREIGDIRAMRAAMEEVAG